MDGGHGDGGGSSGRFLTWAPHLPVLQFGSRVLPHVGFTFLGGDTIGKPSLQPWLRDFGMTAKIRAPEQFYHDLQSNIILAHAFKGLKHISTIAELEAAYPDRQFVSLNPLDLFMQTDNHDHTRTRTHNGGTSSPNLTLLSYN